ncbi:hypothetical protein IQ264_29745 [Phormidium sp. LEGE 05292]|uniref:DUF732 domain-containing protein n=1 Tax=[Phormidium] sp. LEGE 05292 TaxID=767427 RepID=UPI00187E9CA4|nr:DUF732 domain-containing protein [Phormidium sp. LEGE 05292]MBE9229594.1 hypothetical protein [Phormidium sp. LEGE 05292]
MKKALSGIALLISTSIIQMPTYAQNRYYMGEIQGNRADLATNFSDKKSVVVAQLALNKDQEFLNDYRSLAAGQSHSALLLNILNQNPNGHIRLAQNLCTSLKKGKSEQELMQNWVNYWRNSPQEVVQAAIQSGNIMFSIAPKHYCPEFSSR